MRVLVVLLVLLVAAPLRAQNTPDVAAEADQLLVEAERLFTREANYPAALRYFRQSYALRPSSKALSGEALIHEQQGRPILAIAAYEKLLAEFGPTLSEHKRQTVRQRMAQLSARVSLLVLRVEPAGAVITVDDREISLLAGVAQLRVNPGRHTVVATLDGHDTRIERLIVVAGEERTVTMVLPLTQVRLVEPTRYERRMPTWVPWASVGAGVALAAAGAAFQVSGNQDIEDFDQLVADRVGMGGEPADVDPALREDGKRKQTVAAVLFASGGAAVLTGLVLLVVNQPEPVYEPGPRIGFTLDGRGVGVAFSF